MNVVKITDVKLSEENNSVYIGKVKGEDKEFKFKYCSVDEKFKNEKIDVLVDSFGFEVDFSELFKAKENRKGLLEKQRVESYYKNLKEKYDKFKAVFDYHLKDINGASSSLPETFEEYKEQNLYKKGCSTYNMGHPNFKIEKVSGDFKYVARLHAETPQTGWRMKTPIYKPSEYEFTVDYDMYKKDNGEYVYGHMPLGTNRRYKRIKTLVHRLDENIKSAEYKMESKRKAAESKNIRDIAVNKLKSKLEEQFGVELNHSYSGCYFSFANKLAYYTVTKKDSETIAYLFKLVEKTVNPTDEEIQKFFN